MPELSLQGKHLELINPRRRDCDAHAQIESYERSARQFSFPNNKLTVELHLSGTSELPYQEISGRIVMRSAQPNTCRGSNQILFESFISPNHLSMEFQSRSSHLASGRRSISMGPLTCSVLDCPTSAPRVPFFFHPELRFLAYSPSYLTAIMSCPALRPMVACGSGPSMELSF